MSDPGKARDRAARERRLGAALRENLRRRKAQSRARTTQDGDRPEPSAAPADAAASPGRTPRSHDSAGIVDENDPG